MPINQGIFGDTSNFSERYIRDIDSLTAVVKSLKNLGASIVLTSGSFDMVHEGHVKYLERAKELGDVLVVGVDSDAKIRHRKGPGRPIVPEQERLSMLTHFRPVDIVFLKEETDARWGLISAIEPDILVATVDTYTQIQIEELSNSFCGRVEVLDRQATTTTTARIRDMQIDLADRITRDLVEILPSVIQKTINQGAGRGE